MILKEIKIYSELFKHENFSCFVVFPIVYIKIFPNAIYYSFRHLFDIYNYLCVLCSSLIYFQDFLVNSVGFPDHQESTIQTTEL